MLETIEDDREAQDAPATMPAETQSVEMAMDEFDAFKAALDRHAIVAITDRSGTIVHVNDMFCQISGYTRLELLGRKHNVVNSGLHPRRFFADMWRVIANGGLWHGEICNRARDGSLYWVDTTIVPLHGGQDKIRGYLSIRFDVTARKAAEAAVTAEIDKRRQTEMLLRDVIETIPGAVAAFDPDDRLILFNEAYKSYYPVAAPVIQPGTSFETFLRFGVERGQFRLPRQSAEAKEAWIAARLRDHREPGKPRLLQLADGRWLQVRERRSASGHIVGVRTDISELKQAEAMIRRQAEHDPLTGLFNRTVLIERTGEALATALRTQREGALLLIDLDNFKNVNDTLGHDAGDVLLVELGKRLAAAVGKTGVVARLGGDEFAVLLPSATREEAARTAESLLEAVGRPLSVEGRPLVPLCSMGLATFPNQGGSPRELLKHADIALYQAKARGRGTYCLFDPQLRDGIERRQAMRDALRIAIAAGDISIALQPQVRLSDRQHLGFEVLARWRHQEQWIAPAEFIPVAEENGLIAALGSSILEQTLAFAAAMRAEGFDPGRIAINVAAAQLRRGGFARTVLDRLAARGLPPEAIEIELTENVLLDRAGQRIAEELTALNQAGIVVALDDFGTGYASLSHLKRFPVSRLKIDRSFVKDIGTGSDEGIIARTIISLAHNLRMEVVAEGVETASQAQFLAGHGCDVAQGYLFGRPLTPEAAAKYLAREKRRT